MLSELDSANKDTYQKMHRTLVLKLTIWPRKYQPVLEKANQKTFVTQHTAFSRLNDLD